MQDLRKANFIIFGLGWGGMETIHSCMVQQFQAKLDQRRRARLPSLNEPLADVVVGPWWNLCPQLSALNRLP